ncbi:protein of unknown function (plasmid) [Pararobbsia alpina]
MRWKIGLADRTPLAIAGLWRAWSEPDGATALAFTMLTVNADDHPLMKRFLDILPALKDGNSYCA